MTLRATRALRVTVVLAVGALLVLASTGLEILAAHPWFGPVEAPYRWMPAQGWVPPAWLRLGASLAHARALHLAVGGAFVAVALVHVGVLAGRGRWRGHVGPAALTALGCVVVLLVTGLGLWQPVQLRVLVRAAGGDDAARAVHFLALLGLGGAVVCGAARRALGWRRSRQVAGGAPS